MARICRSVTIAALASSICRLYDAVFKFSIGNCGHNHIPDVALSKSLDDFFRLIQ